METVIPSKDLLRLYVQSDILPRACIFSHLYVTITLKFNHTYMGDNGRARKT